MNNKLSNIFFRYDERPDHFRSLDGLRGIAVLFILLSHSSRVGIIFSEWLDFTHCGKYGIYLFFVLSAYLLDRQIGLALTSGRADMGFWRSYLQKRIVRIYPMFIAALIIYYTLNYFDFETVINTALDIPLHLFLVKGESVFWSIPVELKYYVISPFVLLICHKFLKWNFVSVSILIAVCIMIPMAFHYFYNLPHNTTFGFLPVFFVGTFVAIAEILKKNEVISKIRPGYIDGFGTFCFLVVILTIPYFFNAITGENMNFLRPLFYVPYSVCWGIVLLAAKYGNGFIKWVLELKLLRFFGVVSYSIYLLHLPILVYINSDTTIPDWAKIYFFFGATVLLSSVTYVLIERPGLKINLFNLKRDRVE